MFLFLVGVLTVLILILLLLISQDLIHWLLRVGIRVRISKYDVNYAVSLDLP